MLVLSNFMADKYLDLILPVSKFFSFFLYSLVVYNDQSLSASYKSYCVCIWMFFFCFSYGLRSATDNSGKRRTIAMKMIWNDTDFDSILFKHSFSCIPFALVVVYCYKLCFLFLFFFFSSINFKYLKINFFYCQYYVVCCL